MELIKKNKFIIVITILFNFIFFINFGFTKDNEQNEERFYFAGLWSNLRSVGVNNNQLPVNTLPLPRETPVRILKRDGNYHFVECYLFDDGEVYSFRKGWLVHNDIDWNGGYYYSSEKAENKFLDAEKQFKNKIKIFEEKLYNSAETNNQEKYNTLLKLSILNPGNSYYAEQLDYYFKIVSKEKEIEKQKEKQNEIKKLLSEVKKVPVSDFEKNLKYYRRLHYLDPQNVKYNRKIDFYNNKKKEYEYNKKSSQASYKYLNNAEREKEIERQFSVWNGSHRKLSEFIKNNMNDPDSYDHVETVYWDKGTHLIVKTKFRGNNVYGGKVLQSVLAKVDMDGNIIEILAVH